MPEKRQLVLGFCFTPSVYATEDELESYYKATVKPFLSVAYRFPDIHFTLLYSGPLLQWLQVRHSEYMAALSEMLKRKQLEILGGGFFSPLLPLIPPGDRLGQIEELTTTVRKLLGKRPRGLWLTKTVWDPGLVSTIAASGLEFTFLDEKEFERLGIEPPQIDHPRLTEHQGRLLVIFPHHAELSAQVKNGQFEPFLERIRKPSGQFSLVSLFLCLETPQDGGFFHRSETGFEGFLTAVRAEYPLLEAVTPSLYLKRNTSTLERSYFTGTTYQELCARVSLPPPSQSTLQSWKQFLAHDVSANNLYNKMVYVNLLVSSLRGDKYKKKSAYEDLWKAQTYSAYLGNGAVSAVSERKKAFASLLNAEILLRDKPHFSSALSSQDFDLDGVKEFLFQGQRFNYYVDPVGGQLFEWDCLEKPWNYVGMAGHLKQVFVDRFFRIDQPDVDAAAFYDREYKLAELNREQKTFQLVAVEQLQGYHGHQPLRLRKSFTFEENLLVVDYDLELLAGPDWEGWFSSEIHLNFPTPDSIVVREPAEAGVADSVVIQDPIRRLTQHWSWSAKAGLAHVGSPIVPRWWMILHPGEAWHCRISLVLKAED